MNGHHFQAYLAEGLMRWNLDRQAAAQVERPKVRCFDDALVQRINQLSQDIFKEDSVKHTVTPAAFTGNPCYFICNNVVLLVVNFVITWYMDFSLYFYDMTLDYLYQLI